MRWLTAGKGSVGGLRGRWVAAGVSVRCLRVAAFGTGPMNQDGKRCARCCSTGRGGFWNDQIPHRDFYIALGPLQYMIAAVGMRLTGYTPKGLSVGIAIAGALTAIWGWRISRPRMLLVPALLVTAWLCFDGNDAQRLWIARRTR